MFCIYRITNLINGKTYIGQHKYKDNPYDRYMGAGVILHQAYKKYGIENFIKDIIVANIKDKETANKLEIKYIEYERISNGNGCYNIANGGEGSSGCHLSEEHKKRISEANKGKEFSEEWKRNHSEVMKGHAAWNKGKKMSEEYCRKNSEGHKGQVPWNKGIPRSEEEKKKMSESLKGKSHSEEMRKKISEGIKGMRWFNNGEICVRAKECPKGFVPGRLKK